MELTTVTVANGVVTGVIVVTGVGMERHLQADEMAAATV